MHALSHVNIQDSVKKETKKLVTEPQHTVPQYNKIRYGNTVKCGMFEGSGLIPDSALVTAHPDECVDFVLV